MLHTWTVADIARLMDQWYPPSTAETWDRVGLILGDPAAAVTRLLLALDPVACVEEESRTVEADMVITHHPLYLRGTSFLPESDPKGSLVAGLIRSGTALFNAHTNADCAVGGVGEALASRVGLTTMTPLVPTGVDAEGRQIGHGRIGEIEPIRFAEFADRVAAVLPAGPTGLLISGDEDALVRRIAVSGGAGDSFLQDARDAEADVFLTADLRHHPASEHSEGGRPFLMCASHWATESVWLPPLAARLREVAAQANVDLDVKVSTIVTEPWTSHRPTSGGLQ